MIVLKKLIFAPLFLISLCYLLYLLTQIFKSYDVIFSLSLDTLILLILISSFIIVVSLTFVLFATFANDWKYVLPVGILASLIPMLFLNQASGLVFLVGLLASLLLNYVGLENSLKTYLTFQPSSLLGPFIRHLSSLLILIICIVYFLSINKVILEKGFSLPDSLIDTAIKLTQGQGEQTQTPTTQSSLTQDQIELLRKNPDLLKQSGLDIKTLDSLSSPNSPNTTNGLKSESSQASLIKKAIQDQIQTIIKPYLSFVPLILSVLLFLTLQSFVSILNLFIYPLLWIIFYILEKSGFIKFTEEMRTVKKMII